MRGRDLVAQCDPNDRVELASGAGKVHRVWVDESGPRICRPSLLELTKAGVPSEWKRFEGSESEFRRRRCRECDLQAGGWRTR